MLMIPIVFCIVLAAFALGALYERIRTEGRL